MTRLRKRLARSAVGAAWRSIRRSQRRRRLARVVRRSTFTVHTDKLLLGGESGHSAEAWAAMADDALRLSTPLSNGPHVALLRDFSARPEGIFEPGFCEHPYYRNATQAISLTGHYFDAKTADEIPAVARDSLGLTAGRVPTSRARGGTKQGLLPSVRPVRDSDCFSVVDGHHRLAVAIWRGEAEVKVQQVGSPLVTRIQDLVRSSTWTTGRTELYQPLDVPEVAGWPVVRRCVDRLKMMRRFLSSIDGGLKTYLDVGSSYGWFLKELRADGFEVRGIEVDRPAARVGSLVWGVEEGVVDHRDIYVALAETEETFDVVSALSVLHHFQLGKNVRSAEEVLRELDRITGSVLFVDSGECTESWFRDSLPGITPTFLESWMLANSSFRQAISLGVDADDRPPYQGNYGRTLFALVR